MLHFISTHRKLLFRLIVGAVSFVFFGFFVPIILSTTSVEYSNWLFNLQPTPTLPPVSREFDLLGKEAVDATIGQLEGFRLDGTFAASMHCFRSRAGQKAGDAKCTLSNYRTLPPAYLVIIFDQLADSSSQSRYKKEADRIFGEFLRRCVVDKAACEEGFVAIEWRYQKGREESLLSALKFAGDWLLSITPQSAAEQILAAHKLIKLYDYFDDKVYLDKANQLIDGLNQLISESGDPQSRDYLCGKYWLYAELAKPREDENLLVQAREFFNNIDKEIVNIQHLGGFNMCLEGLSFLNKETGEANFGRLHQKLVSYVLSNFWDSANKPKFTADYGILLLDYSKSKTNRMLNFKYVNEAAWFLTHLMPYQTVMLRY